MKSSDISCTKFYVNVYFVYDKMYIYVRKLPLFSLACRD